VKDICWHKSEIPFFYVSRGNKVLLWDLEHPHAPVHELSVPAGPMSAMTVLDDNRIALGFNSGLVQVCTCGQADVKLPNHSSTIWVRRLCVSVCVLVVRRF
jgi:hypothetical protein